MANILSRIWNGWQTKSVVPQPVNAVVDPGLFGVFLNPQEITPFQADLLFRNVSPLAKVVNLIADQVANLQPLIKVDGQVVNDTPLHALLKRPGFNRTRHRFVKELAVQYLVTGTAYPHVMGNSDRIPLAFDVLKSKMVSITPGADMWPDQYMYAEGTRSITFKRNADARDPRWLDDSGFGEIVPIYDIDGTRRGVGLSRMNAIKADVELRFQGIQHNKAMLENGARMSGVLAFKDELNDEQKESVRQQFEGRHAGALNAGKTLITQGGDVSFTSLQASAKDMDFDKLIRTVEDAIVAAYNVPVTLFRTEAQTNNNYETAWFMCYDNAILPTFQAIYAGISQIFAERLTAMNNGVPVEVEIGHDALTNTVLMKQASAMARELFNARLVSRNEARKRIGMEPVLGGDTIYGPMGDTPVAEDYFTDHGTPGDLTAEAFHEARNQKLPNGAPADQDHALNRPAAGDKKPAAKKSALLSVVH
jgi:HK97 family phage portal protein